MRRRLIGKVNQIGRASGGRGKKRAIRGRGRGRSRLASGRWRGRGKINNIIFFRYHEQKMPGWPHDKKSCQLEHWHRNMGFPTPSCRRGLQGQLQTWPLAVEGAKATPTYWPNLLKVNLNSSHYLLTFSNICV